MSQRPAETSPSCSAPDTADLASVESAPSPGASPAPSPGPSPGATGPHFIAATQLDGGLACESVAQRYQRYLPVIQCVYEQQSFDINQIKQAVLPEKPAFVTRLINELVGQGWLVAGPTPRTFQWNSGRGPFSISRWLDDKLLGSQVKLQPQQDRPRERLLELGPQPLRSAELLAILIRSGRPGESAIAAGEKLAKQFQGRLELLPDASRVELKAISSAVDVTAYCQIMAGIELGRRIAALSADTSPTRIHGSQDAIEYCRHRFQRLAQAGKQEEFHVVTLDTKRQVLGTHQITVGTLDSSLVHPREVFRPAIRDAASGVLLVHNHPSGDPTPSRADQAVTDRLSQAGELLGIDVLDHIILGRPRILSMKAEGSI